MLRRERVREGEEEEEGRRDGEKNAKRQVICALIPASYVRAKGQKSGWCVERKQAGRWGKNNTRVQGWEKGKVQREEEVMGGEEG